jgi:hypothetical protein
MKRQAEGSPTKAFQQKQRELSKFYKPAFPDDCITAQLRGKSEQWVKAVTDTLLEHYKSKLSIFRKTLKEIVSKHLDLDLSSARDLALGWAKKNFNKKLRTDTITLFLEIFGEAKNSRQPFFSPPRPATNVPSLLDLSTPPALAIPIRQTGTARTSTSPARKPRQFIKPFRAENTNQKDRKWEFHQISAPTLIMGTSNISAISQTQVKNLDIRSFPGTKLKHLTALFRKASKRPTKKPTRIIISAGINDRENSPAATIYPEFKRMVSAAKSAFPDSQFSFVIPQFGPGLPREHQANIHTFNKMVETGPCGMTVIPWINQAKFQIEKRDPTRIHWTTTTANDLLDHWLETVGLLN